MTKLVDLDLLRQATVDALRVYEALLDADAFADESRRALDAGEALLKQASLGYLRDTAKVLPHSPDDTRSAQEEMVSSYIQVQRATAQLKDALYRLGKAHLATGSHELAVVIFRALRKIEPDYRDVLALLRQALWSKYEPYFEFLSQPVSSARKFGQAALLNFQGLQAAGGLQWSSESIVRSTVDMAQNVVKHNNEIFVAHVRQCFAQIQADILKNLS